VPRHVLPRDPPGDLLKIQEHEMRHGLLPKSGRVRRSLRLGWLKRQQGSPAFAKSKPLYLVFVPGPKKQHPCVGTMPCLVKPRSSQGPTHLSRCLSPTKFPQSPAKSANFPWMNNFLTSSDVMIMNSASSVLQP